MTIDRNNYEEFFILYLDNELDENIRRQVEAFATNHPDLKEELNLLSQSKLLPDESIVFQDKAELMRTASESIHAENAQEWLLSYIDNELNADQRRTVESYVAAHSEAKAELELLMKSVMAPELITFPDKQSLYRHEEKARVVVFTWRRIAVAASLLLLLSIGSYFIIASNKPDGDAVARENAKNIQKTKNIALPDKKEQHVETATTGTHAPVDKDAQAPLKNSKTNREQSPLKSNNDQQTEMAHVKVKPNAVDKSAGKDQKDDAQLAVNNKNENKLPSSEKNPNVNANLDPSEGRTLAINRPVRQESLTIPSQINASSQVTLDRPDALQFTKNTIDEEPELPETGKKNKLRGIFRKITRTFEKTTNIKATDDEDRLLVGGLAIRL